MTEHLFFAAQFSIFVKTLVQMEILSAVWALCHQLYAEKIVLFRFLREHQTKTALEINFLRVALQNLPHRLAQSVAPYQLLCSGINEPVCFCKVVYATYEKRVQGPW